MAFRMLLVFALLVAAAFAMTSGTQGVGGGNGCPSTCTVRICSTVDRDPVYSVQYTYELHLFHPPVRGRAIIT